MAIDKIERKLTLNTEYIDWIVQFLQNRNAFVDKDFLLKPYKEKGRDHDNVLLIGKFYDEIDNYAREHNIFPESNGETYWYGIVYNGFHIEINRSLDDCYCKSGLMHVCWKIRKDELAKSYGDTFFIDFNDILENKTPDKVMDYQQQLEEISNFILWQSRNAEIPFTQLLGTIYRSTDQIIDEYEGSARVRKIISEEKY